MMKKFFAKAYIYILLLLLYAPLIFIAVCSFTEAKVLGNWTGFSTKLYSNLFSNAVEGGNSLIAAIQNTLIYSPLFTCSIV